MSVKVLVKGGAKTAQKSGRKHGVILKNCRRVKRGETMCEAPCHQELKVMRWFGATSRIREGYGYPQGTLLFYRSRCSR